MYILIKTISEKKFNKIINRDTDKINVINCPKCQEKLVLFQFHKAIRDINICPFCGWNLQREYKGNRKRWRDRRWKRQRVEDRDYGGALNKVGYYKTLGNKVNPDYDIDIF